MTQTPFPGDLFRWADSSRTWYLEAQVMFTRLLFACVAAFALTVLTTSTAWAKADDKGDTHSGVVVSASGGKLTMSDKDGKNEHTHDVAKDAKISCNGKDCKLEDLKKGTAVKVTMKDKKAVQILGSTKK
jgi:hypothetical protein